MFNWLSGVRPGSRMPLSQAISDTDCIMRARNQLTAAGSCRESMILNRNQDKLNLTLSPARPSCHENSSQGWGTAESASSSSAASPRRGGRRQASHFTSGHSGPPCLVCVCLLPHSPVLPGSTCEQLRTSPQGSWLPLREEIKGLPPDTSLAATVTPHPLSST